MLLVWFAALGFVAIQRQDIVDWWKLHSYDAPVAVTALATQNTMTDYATKVFYVNQPAITPKSNFGEFCPNNGGEQTIVLGCYHAKQNGIYILQVSDSRLNGVEQVTAAHEMLHAAYDRLSSSERQRVDGMLEDYYRNGLTDQRIKTTIDSYKQSEPNDVVNEMHSIFGTEVASLPTQLQEYYKQYFNNRAAVVGYAAAYQGEFTSRQNIVAQDDAKLAGMKTQIDQLNADLKSKQTEISAEQASLNGYKASGDTAEYNSGVPAYNALVNEYNAQLNQLRALIREYNSLVNARNAVAGEADQLTKELNSSATPINK